MIDVGATYTATFSVVNSQGAPADAATVTLTVTKPDQTTDSFTLAGSTVTRDGIGQYHVDYVPSAEGLYRLSWSSTGPARVSTDVLSATDWHSVVGVQEAKDFINDSDADQDPILRQIMAAATELAENIVGACVPRRYVGQRIPGTIVSVKQCIRVPKPPVLTESSVETIVSVWPGGPSWSTADLLVSPDSGLVEPTNMIGFWYGPWKITYTAGRQVVPQSIQLGVKEIIFDMWSIHRPYGADQMEPGPEDTARFEQMLATYTIPPHAKSLLLPYEQPGFA